LPQANTEKKSEVLTMEATRTRIAKTQGDFARAFHTLNSDRCTQTFSEQEKELLKQELVGLYDLTTSLWHNVRSWNWGLDDEAMHSYLAGRIPCFDAFDSDGYSEQLYCFTLSQIPRAMRSMGRILEVGCGAGAGLNFLSRLEPGARFVGLDLSGPTIEIAAARLARGSQLRFVQGDAERLPFADEEFDCVICVESAHNYPDLQKFLAEVSRVLKVGGFLSLVDLFTQPRRALTDLSMHAISGMNLVAEADVTQSVKRAVSKRMQPGSVFRKWARESAPFPFGWLNEHVQMLAHGAEFAGADDFGVRLVRKLGSRSRSRVVFDSYHHYLAVKA
jgi:ubiquinone/menaquinone biosynthesis C-methylase UbiE